MIEELDRTDRRRMRRRRVKGDIITVRKRDIKRTHTKQHRV